MPSPGAGQSSLQTVVSGLEHCTTLSDLADLADLAPPRHAEAVDDSRRTVGPRARLASLEFRPCSRAIRTSPRIPRHPAGSAVPKPGLAECCSMYCAGARSGASAPIWSRCRGEGGGVKSATVQFGGNTPTAGCARNRGSSLVRKSPFDAARRHTFLRVGILSAEIE